MYVRLVINKLTE